MTYPAWMNDWRPSQSGKRTHWGYGQVSACGVPRITHGSNVLLEKCAKCLRIVSMHESKASREDYKEAKRAIAFLVDFLKRKGVADGLDADYDGGSYADDLRGLQRVLDREYLS